MHMDEVRRLIGYLSSGVVVLRWQQVQFCSSPSLPKFFYLRTLLLLLLFDPSVVLWSVEWWRWNEAVKRSRVLTLWFMPSCEKKGSSLILLGSSYNPWSPPQNRLFWYRCRSQERRVRTEELLMVNVGAKSRGCRMENLQHEAIT